MLKKIKISGKQYLYGLSVIWVLCMILSQTVFSVSNILEYNENEDIINLITKYYSEKNESLFSEEKQDISAYFVDGSSIEKYIEFKNEYYLNSRKASKHKYLWVDTKIVLNEIEVSGDVAEVSIDEIFTCQYEERTVESSVGITHMVKLLKVNKEWKINDIISNDEYDRAYRKMDISIITKLLTEESAEVNDTYKNYMETNEKDMAALLKQLTSTKSWTLTTYDRTEATDYALYYSSDTTGSSSYNSLFVDCTSYGGDCQNFGSQSIFAGFGGDYNNSTAINGKDLPMIDSGYRAWWATSSQVVDIADEDAVYGNGAHWSNCVDFGEYAADGGSGKEGIYAWIYTGSVDYVYPGDMIQIRSSSSGNDWYHTYVVTSISGTQGQLDPDDIYICAHTANVNNDLLSSRGITNEALLRVIRIGWHYHEN